VTSSIEVVVATANGLVATEQGGSTIFLHFHHFLGRKFVFLNKICELATQW